MAPELLQPMLASLTEAPLDDPEFVYEPKYDGIRAIAEIGGRASDRAGSPPPVQIWSRLGNDKTAQFREVADALRRWARKRRDRLILDGEIVALNADGRPIGFQNLQGRIHIAGQSDSRPATGSVAFVAFDILRDGATDFRKQPLLERRRALERVFGHTGSSTLRISDMVVGDGRSLYQQALDQGWEGLIAKRKDSEYRSGKRSPDWRKLKIVHEQEFVVGGWTEPRHTRAYFGALLLGVYEGDALVYVGHTGTGFNERELSRVMKLLKPLETTVCPFNVRPKTNERPHWVRPELVAQIKFTEWTADARLRHPVYIGLRDDKNPRDVAREQDVRLHSTAKRSTAGTGNLEPGTVNQNLLDQLNELEASRRNGTLVLADGDRLAVTNLHKIFWPKLKLTKGDLFRYYVRVAPFVLPAVADRPLVMKRFPNGVDAPPFYQHRVQDVPAGVRVETVSVAQTRPQLVGGTLKTLLHMVQLAAISQDPWFSRVGSIEHADYVALDLDPPDGLPFRRVLDIALWIRDELDALGATGVAKTSGADGLHIYIPLPRATPYEAGLLVCQIVATVVAQKHPKEATIERSVAARGRRVYIDYLQNILGKTLATAYSARASAYAGVSTPLSWKEIEQGVKREDYTISTVPGRLETVGDLWAPLRASKGIDLSRISRYAERVRKRSR